MSEKVMADLRLFEKNKPAKLVTHPLYDNFGDILSKEAARQHLQLPQHEKIILFFGFIRKYKGLDLLLEAMPLLPGVKLLVAGEFYEDEKQYQEQIDRLDIRSQLILKTAFIPDSEVKYYLCAADAVIQPYRNATQSGVTPLAFHFEKPMVVTNVGGLPAMITSNETGIITEPDPGSIAKGITAFYEAGENKFIPYIQEKKKQYSWKKMIDQVMELFSSIK
jgi:glycosyltransferase involved in cell wall biosynthesis